MHQTPSRSADTAQDGDPGFVRTTGDAYAVPLSSPYLPQRYATEVGAAVLKLCLEPDYEPTADGLRRVNGASVFNHGGCVMLVDQVHSSAIAVYAWIGNRLVPIATLDEDHLQIVKGIVEKQQATSG